MMIKASATLTLRMWRRSIASSSSSTMCRAFATFSSTAALPEESWQRMNDRTRQLAQALILSEHETSATAISGNATTATTAVAAANNQEQQQHDNKNDAEQLKTHLLFQRRFALARAITLVESRAASHREQADLLLTYLLNAKKQSLDHSFRIGLAGPPGAGKSTLIECFGKYILNLTRDDDDDATNTAAAESTTSSSSSSYPNFVPEKLAVVCIDPSSSVTGGSILGDKTRMIDLSRHERAFVRPSANGGTFGGLSAYTHDVVSLCQAADYRLVLVETVGLGQSEIEVAESVDMLLLVVPPGGGDELQGVKKGIVEVADMLLVTKADGNLLPAARSTAADYRAAMKFQRQRYLNWGPPPVLLTSAVTGDGMDKVWKEICKFRNTMIETKELQRKRQRQAKYWMWKNLQNLISQKTKDDVALQQAAQDMEQALLDGTITPRVAASELLDSLLHHSTSSSTSSTSSSSS